MKKLASGMVILAGILWGSMGIFVRKFEIWFFRVIGQNVLIETAFSP